MCRVLGKKSVSLNPLILDVFVPYAAYVDNSIYSAISRVCCYAIEMLLKNTKLTKAIFQHLLYLKTKAQNESF